MAFLNSTRYPILNFKPSVLLLALSAALYGCNNSDSDSGSDSHAANNTQSTPDEKTSQPAAIVNPDIGGGKILFYTTSGEFIDVANVGNLPDMVTFSNATTLVVVNELSSSLGLYELGADGTASKIKSISLGDFGQGDAEILASSPEDKNLFVTNAQTQKVDVFDVSMTANASRISSSDFSDHADDLQSVSVKYGVLAIAVKRI